VIELNDVTAWRAYAREQRAAGRVLGLVPTMGAFHEGHVSLFHAAKAECDVVLVTSFVNPRQFNDADDFARYPKTPDLDRALAAKNGVDCFVAPSLAEMWPDFPDATPTTVSVGALGERFEGTGRPGHFDGVASVVAKLFVVTGRCRAYFGEKDFQQLAVIRQMARDLAFDVEVVGRPIIRDEEGLAFSSRNVRLSAEGRARALGFSRALAALNEALMSASEARATLRAVMEGSGIEVAYAEVVDPVTLTPSSDEESGPRRALVAGFVDGVRLLDNAPVEIKGEVACS
jgi:pantoate--beta-alanine ligase